MAPIILLSDPFLQCLTFFWREHPRWWIGYRVCEGFPEMDPRPILEEGTWPAANWGAIPTPGKELLALEKIALPRKRWRTAYREKVHSDPIQLAFQAFADGSAWCSLNEGNGQQQREFFFRPVEDGVQMWMRLTTQIPITGSYLVQQCLRFTGAQNWSKRRNIALVPFLSELDVQAMGHPDLSLTYARQEKDWLKIPARHMLYKTPQGNQLTGQEVSESVDHGLIVRETLDRHVVPASYFRRTAPGETWRQVAAGLYWERTALMSNRHPADCVHAVVDLGPLNAGDSRTVHGKFYWIEGTKDDLLASWSKDFPAGENEKQ